MRVSRRVLKCSELGIQGCTSEGASLPQGTQTGLQPPKLLTPEPCVYCSGRKKNEPLNKEPQNQLHRWGWCISMRVIFVESTAALPNEEGSN